MLIGSFICLSSLIYSPGVIAKEERKITQHEFIMHLAKAMNLKLPEGAQINDYIKALESRGISIPGGYRPNTFITTKQMAIMLIPAMGLDKTKFERIKEQINQSYKDKAIIINIVGDVKIKTKEIGQWQEAKPGIALDIEDTIKTGIASTAIIRLGEITVARVKENTTITVYQLAKNPIIYMEEGDIILDTSGSPMATNHYIITPTTVAAVRGTIIETIYKKDPTQKEGVTTVLVAQGTAETYNVSAYTLPEKLAMVRTDKFLVNAIEITQGNYLIKDKIYSLSKEQLESILVDVEDAKAIIDTDLLGEVSEKFLEENGVKEKDYLEINIEDKKQ